jgi:branched-chain amino acid transport system ATP-binding protein
MTGPGAVDIDGLTVRFGGVTSLDGMSVRFEAGACGLIGPNGAGKTTFFNVLSGFVRPSAGTVRAFGADLLAMVHYRRSRWGLRRTFQTEQAIEDLSVFENVAMVHEHSGLGGRGRHQDVLSAISFAGLDGDPGTRCAPSARPSALVEWPGPWLAGPGWCCSTNPPLGCRTKRPGTWPT